MEYCASEELHQRSEFSGLDRGESAGVGDFQVAVHPGDVELKSGVIPFTTLNLDREDAPLGQCIDGQHLVRRVVRKAFTRLN
jgi:hypothetical protein